MQYYTLTELAQETGVSRRRIRAWIQRGILPRGVNADRPHDQIRAHQHGVYTYEHVRRILAVRELLDQNRSLADIRDHFHPLFGDRP